ncbi:MAG: aminoacetone oxidase family FAD-binding enzyme [Kiritimatiellae bacterium]|nr:aminoacetone oxidase family FAD-binding enzyme [Kiritimatiellia bacterium]
MKPRQHQRFKNQPKPDAHKPGPRKPDDFHLPLTIVGGGAAGLFAGCIAGEGKLPSLIMERKHKPARKLLMCGNGRCNLTKNISAAQMLEEMGEPAAAFLNHALNACPPAAIMRWFEQHRLNLKQMPDRRIFPRTEKASDVLHTLTDTLRDTATALALNTTVGSIETTSHPTAGFIVSTQSFKVFTRNVLLTTGGVSYPKTGSVGDGQKIAKALGHSLLPYRPGLIGFVIDHPWIRARQGHTMDNATIRIICDSRLTYAGEGQLDCESWGIGGAAAYNASRWLARHQPADFELEWQVQGEIIRVRKPATRPLKEAIVTVGGVPLNEINPRTMESLKCPGLYFAGEIMDIDGPTGGYNLSAAFATAKCAVDAARGG